MAKKGIKVNELARELGVTSRRIIDRCRTGGLPVQNSITRLTPETERAVRLWFGKTRDAPRTDEPPGEPEDATGATR